MSENQVSPKGSAEPVGPGQIDIQSGFKKVWRGLARTWKLYRRSKMGLIGLGIVLGFFIMAAFAPFISPYSPDFRAPSEDIFIADNANLQLPHRNWTTPIGIINPTIEQALMGMMVYSTEGETLVYPVKPGLSDVTNEPGIIVGEPTTRTLPANLSYVKYVQFPTPFPTGGNPLIASTFFFLLEGDVLHEWEANLVDSQVEWRLPFVPKFHSNLWNGYTPISNTARMALAFANESSVWLLVKRPSAPPFSSAIATWNSTVTIPGAKIISSPLVTDTFEENGSILAVPTDIGLYVYKLNVTEPYGHSIGFVSSVTIGNLLWKTDYHLTPTDVIQPIDSENTITFPNPATAGSLFGKTSILLATKDGRVISYNTFNGTVQWAARVVMPTIRDYDISALYPSPRAVIVTGKTGARGFIAAIDPDFGAVLFNKTAFSTTEGLINSQPAFVEGLFDFIYSTDIGNIYLTTETMKINATFSVPGGMSTPVAYLGNIYTSTSVTGNYFGTITEGDALYAETLSGVNTAPLPPGKYPSGNRYILGTDYEGHDILSWLIYGTRSELLVGVTAAVFAVVIGTVVGLVAGFYSGFVDDLLMRATDVVLSLPFIVIALLFASVFGPLLINIIIIIAVLSWAGIARVIRSVTLSLKERSFVDAAIIAGASESRLIFRHIAPNVLPYTFLYMTFTVSGAIITEAILAFLGFGDPSNVTWGMMLQFLQISGHSLDAPWWLLPPGIAITLLSLSFYLIGRAFDEVVNPRLRRR